MTPSMDALAQRFAGLKGARGGRALLAVAGPPGSGKSTLAEGLCEALQAAGRAAALVPMDGFHLDNRVIEPRGLLHRKGAPETFDAAGFATMIRRLGEGGEVIHPVFDRSRDIAIAGAGVVPASCDLVVAEGNYLLFGEDDWRGLSDLWDASVWLDVPEEELRRRLTARWLDYGLDADAAAARAEGNDLANARRVIAGRLPATVTVTQ